MGALLGFAPFIGFASIENLLGAVPGLAASPRFVRTNNILSGEWALAFTVLATIDLVMVQRINFTRRRSVSAWGHRPHRNPRS